MVETESNSVKQTPAILGVALGDPASPRTYSGVPYHLFGEFRRMGCLAGTADSYGLKPWDALRGAMDFRRSLHALRPRRHALWRYRTPGMRILSQRLQKQLRNLPPHDVVFQIGVGALPDEHTPLAAHVEISVATAVSTEIFARNYGFYGHSSRLVRQAIEGERHFLQRCSLVWTNSHWTAQGLYDQGVEEKRLFVCPPAAGSDDPGPCPHDWDKFNILFVGIDWTRKGGRRLLQAFAALRRECPSATLTIIRCTPDIKMDGVRVLGYLHKNIPAQAAQLQQAYRSATLFCMPSLWESTGLVYIEAALWSLPVVMLKGQGREEIFPPSMAVHVESTAPQALADVLIELSRSPQRMADMGRAGRELVLQRYTWPKVAARLYDHIRNVL